MSARNTESRTYSIVIPAYDEVERIEGTLTAMRAYLDSWHQSGSPWEMWVEQVDRLRGRFAASIGADVDEVRSMVERLPVRGWTLEQEAVLRRFYRSPNNPDNQCMMFNASCLLSVPG